MVYVSRLAVSVLYCCLLIASALAKTRFEAVWNVPSSKCVHRYNYSLPLDTFNIKHNRNFSFYGDQIVIFYGKKLGLYPFVTREERKYKLVNGGIPQNVDLEEHLEQTMADIEAAIPDENFAGLAVIDWEDWRPVWSTNWGQMRIYKTLSKQLIRKQHPKWPQKKINKRAKINFQSHARTLMLTTLNLGKSLRPFARWGFYGFPACYGHTLDKTHCDAFTNRVNKRLRWLYESSTAIFPSIYLRRRSRANHLHIQAELNLAVAVRGVRLDVSIYAYVMLAYDTYASRLKFLVRRDLCSSLKQTADFGLEGVVLWSSSTSMSTRSKCDEMSAYISATLGPYIARVQRSADACSKLLCSSRGVCVHEPENHCTGSALIKACKCYPPWYGYRCKKHYHF